MLYTKLRAAIPHNVAEIRPEYSHKVKPADLPQISNPQHSADIVRPFFELPELREEFKAILLNKGNKVLGVVNISTGTGSSCIVDLPLIVALACTCRASGVVLAHNHPSDRLTPSEADKQITKKAKEALKLVDVHLIDHIILNSTGFYSFLQEDIL